MEWRRAPGDAVAMREHPASRAPIRDGAILVGLLFAAYLFLFVAPAVRTVGFDAVAYWSVDLDHPYERAAGEFAAFPYTPVAARLFAPASLLSWPAFWFVWTAILTGTVIWLGWSRGDAGDYSRPRRSGWSGRRTPWLGGALILAFPPVAVELYHGNVHLLLAAAIALGFRYPWTWALVLLTKVTPGVGLVWFAVRREWRQLAIAVGVTAAITIASLIVDGRLWGEWISDGLLAAATQPLTQPSIAIPFALRFPAALAIVFWGARTDRPWTVPVAAALALPILWFAGLSLLAAIPALARPALAPPRR